MKIVNKENMENETIVRKEALFAQEYPSLDLHVNYFKYSLTEIIFIINQNRTFVAYDHRDKQINRECPYHNRCAMPGIVTLKEKISNP
jgi:hypothetical protein